MFAAFNAPFVLGGRHKIFHSDAEI
jgi:hypothetical protein